MSEEMTLNGREWTRRASCEPSLEFSGGMEDTVERFPDIVESSTQRNMFLAIQIPRKSDGMA
jgi:hypothetical protein